MTLNVIQRRRRCTFCTKPRGNVKVFPNSRSSFLSSESISHRRFQITFITDVLSNTSLSISAGLCPYLWYKSKKCRHSVNQNFSTISPKRSVRSSNRPVGHFSCRGTPLFLDLLWVGNVKLECWVKRGVEVLLSDFWSDKMIERISFSCSSFLPQKSSGKNGDLLSQECHTKILFPRHFLAMYMLSHLKNNLSFISGYICGGT